MSARSLASPSPSASVLLSATVSLSRADSAHEIATAISRSLVDILRADGSAVYECTERAGEKGLVLLRERGFEAEALDDFGWVPLEAATPVTTAARTGEMEVLPTLSALQTAYPHLAREIHRAGRCAVATFPLRIGERITGAITALFDQPRELSAEERAFTAVLAEQCALALERVRLFSEEHAARCRAEALQHLALALSTVETPEGVASAAVQRGMQLGDTTYGVLSLLSDDLREFRVVTAPDSAQPIMEQWRTYPNAGPLPAAVAVRTGEPCYSRSRAEYVARAPGLEIIADAVGLQSEAVLPLRIGERTLGVLSFEFNTPLEFRKEDDAFLRAVADLTAQSLERARLLQSEREAREQAERVGRERAHDAEELEQLYQSSPLGLAFIDRDLRYVRINAVLADMNGQTMQWHVGKTVREVLPSIAYAIEPAFRDVVENGRCVSEFEFSGELQHRPGELRDTLSSFLPVHDHDGRVKGINVIVQDITERKRAERQAQASEAALQEASRRKDEFLATLAHELRNPLAPICNALEVLQLPEGQDSDKTRAHDVIDRQVKQLTRLVDDLLDVSRINQGRLELKRAIVDLRAVLGMAVETSRPLLEENRHRLRVELGHDPLPLHADAMRLSQVFANLLNNAAKYMAPGGEVTLRVRRRFDTVQVSVIDHGMGIPTDQRTQIFEMFRQVGSARHRARGGLGIGLSLVRRIVEMHAGRVTVESALGAGSTFTVELPLHLTFSDSQSPMPTPARSDTSPRRQVLLVDDNTDAAETLAILLEAVGHQVHVAHTGAEALAKARVSHPDVVLLDLGLPDISGLDVCRALRADSATRGAFIVALTGWGQEEDRRQTTEARFDLHLVKPVHPSRIRDLLAERLANNMPE